MLEQKLVGVEHHATQRLEPVPGDERRRVLRLVAVRCATEGQIEYPLHTILDAVFLALDAPREECRLLDDEFLLSQMNMRTLNKAQGL